MRLPLQEQRTFLPVFRRKMRLPLQEQRTFLPVFRRKMRLPKKLKLSQEQRTFLPNKKCRNPTKDSCTKTLAIPYLPTLALSKSGFGLKHPLTLSPPMRAPHFHFTQLPLHSILIFHITSVISYCFQQQQFYYTRPLWKCKVFS